MIEIRTSSPCARCRTNMRVIVALAIGIVTQVAASDICENGWIMYAGHCYKQFMGKPLMQAEAEAECVMTGGHLVSINNRGENDFIKTFAKIGGTQTYKNQPWIGLIKMGDEFVWTDGTTGRGWVWGEGEPTGEDCVVMIVDVHPNYYSGATGVLADLSCNFNTTRFICERAPGVASTEQEYGCPVEDFVTDLPVTDSSSLSVTTSSVTNLPVTDSSGSPVTGEPETTADCKNGWQAYGNHCYKHFNCTVRTQPEAEAECVRLGGHLASINTPSENSFIHSISRMEGTHALTSEPWIGLIISRDSANQRVFGWTDGSTGVGVKWAPGKPYGAELCGMFLPDAYSNPYVPYNGETGVTTNARCSYPTSRFICERESGVEPNVEECAPIVEEKECPVTECPVGTGRTPEGCRCLSGSIDIVDTELPGKDDHEPGTMCLSEKPCDATTEPMSVIFVMDASGSIETNNWPDVVALVKTAATKLPLSTHVGFVKYSSEVTESKWLQNGWTETEFVEAVPNAFDRGGTKTELGLDKAAGMMLTENNSKKVVILITDGASYEPKLTFDSATKLQNEGSRLVILDIGYGDQTEMETDLVKSWLQNKEDYFQFQEDVMTLNELHMRYALAKVCEST